jgi:hypothetical protein
VEGGHRHEFVSGSTSSTPARRVKDFRMAAPPQAEVFGRLGRSLGSELIAFRRIVA